MGHADEAVPLAQWLDRLLERLHGDRAALRHVVRAGAAGAVARDLLTGAVGDVEAAYEKVRRVRRDLELDATPLAASGSPAGAPPSAPGRGSAPARR